MAPVAVAEASTVEETAAPVSVETGAEPTKVLLLLISTSFFHQLKSFLNPKCILGKRRSCRRKRSCCCG